MMHTMS